jgi:hypothetical protein
MMITALDHYESRLGRVYSWMVGESNQPAPSVQLAAGAVSINRLLAYTRTGNLPISRAAGGTWTPFHGESGNSEVLGRKSWPRRQKWFSDYIKAIKKCDLRTSPRLTQY